MGSSEAGTPPAKAAGLRSRAVVTIGAILIFLLGCRIPIAGINLDVLQDVYRLNGAAFGPERFSIFGLGVTPVISVLAITEIFMLVIPDFRRWVAGSERNRNRYHQCTFVIALAMATLQGWGVTAAMEAFPQLVQEPGETFRLAAIATYVGATAFLMWLANLISSRGLAPGLWLLFILPLVLTIPDTASAMMQAQHTSGSPSMAVVAVLAVLAIATTAVGWSARATQSDDDIGNLLWPPILALAVLQWLMAQVFLLAPLTWAAAMSQWGLAGHPFRLIILTLLTAGFALWRPSSIRQTVPNANNSDRVAQHSLLLAGAVLATEITVGWSGLPFPMGFDGPALVVVVVVAVALLKNAQILSTSP